jgi:phage gpG-like protein
MVKYRINSEQYDKAVQEALKNVKTLKPVFIQIAREFYKTNRAIFTLQSAGKYPDFKLSDESRRLKNGMTPYQNWKNKRVGGRGYPLLRLTGRLEKSITQQGGEAITEIGDKSVVIGTTVPYGVFHQQPNGRGKGIIPYRPFLFLDPATTAVAPDGSLSRRSEAWVRMINQYVARSMKAMGTVTEGGTNG